MDKQNILIIFPTLYRAEWFFREQIAPYISYKKVNNNIYEFGKFKFILCNDNSQSLRGRRADFIYLSDDSHFKTYNLVLNFVKGDHSKIKVVI